VSACLGQHDEGGKQSESFERSANMGPHIFIALMVLLGGIMEAQSVPAAIFTDPPVDAAHPAGLAVLHIPSHGVEINGMVYQPSGAGPHPTMVIFHGLPGNEKNLDLAQAVRRAGWNAVTFNYRGSWGSPGVFRLSQNLEDAEGVLAYLRDPANARQLGVDPHRIVLAGHSMGGWVVVHTASHDHDLMGVILISAADLTKLGEWPRDRLVALMAGCMGPLAGTTPERLADEAQALSRKDRFEDVAANLTQLPVLALTADDGFTPDADALVHAIEARGGHNVTVVHVSTDHNWSDHRVWLESTILTWLAELNSGAAKNSRPVPLSTQTASVK
jgi:uncharacterized protein